MAGSTQRVRFTLRPVDLAVVDRAGRSVIEPGAYDVMVGGRSATFQLLEGRPAAPVKRIPR
jgi:hypothetical protein